MAFLASEHLIAMGFKSLGANVRISEKAMIYNADQMELGDNTRIDDFCVVSGKVGFGRNVHIAVFCNIAGGSEGVFMSDFSGLAYGCHVISQSDDYSGRTMTNPTIPPEFKHETKKAIHIGRHCIVGTNSLIFPGVHLGDGCAVGAMSMVTRSTEEWSVYSGIPAVKLKNRKRDLLELETAYLRSQHG